MVFKRKKNQLSPIKIKHFCSIEDPLGGGEDRPQSGRRRLRTMCLTKGSRLEQAGTLKLNIRKSQPENGQMTRRGVSAEGIRGRQTRTRQACSVTSCQQSAAGDQGEAPPPPVRTAKQTAVSIPSGTAQQEEGTAVVQGSVWASGPYTQRGTPISKGHMVSDSIYMTFLKRQHCRDGRQICGWQG